MNHDDKVCSLPCSLPKEYLEIQGSGLGRPDDELFPEENK